jgi:hypothetical protein
MYSVLKKENNPTNYKLVGLFSNYFSALLCAKKVKQTLIVDKMGNILKSLLTH